MAGGVTIVDISGQIVLGDESAVLRGLVRDLLGPGYMLRRNLSRWFPRKDTSVLAPVVPGKNVNHAAGAGLLWRSANNTDTGDCHRARRALL